MAERWIKIDINDDGDAHMETTGLTVDDVLECLSNILEEICDEVEEAEEATDEASAPPGTAVN